MCTPFSCEGRTLNIYYIIKGSDICRCVIILVGQAWITQFGSLWFYLASFMLPNFGCELLLSLFVLYLRKFLVCCFVSGVLILVWKNDFCVTISITTKEEGAHWGVGADEEGSKQVRLVSSSVWTDRWCGAWGRAVEDGGWWCELSSACISETGTKIWKLNGWEIKYHIIIPCLCTSWLMSS